jgi:hypothetical protein
MSFAAAERIAHALLYEGYALYPYRASSLKNQQRWTFGGLFPSGGVGEPSQLHSECLVRGLCELDVRLKFLQLFGQQAVERQVTSPGPFELPAPEGGRPLRGELRLALTELAAGLHRVAVTVKNLGAGDEPKLRSFAAPHVLLHARSGGELVSMIDPPPELQAAAEACRNEVTWPVLLAKDLMLCSPIILEDFPRVAPESPADLFDSSEIDEILILRILTLTDAEKREARADPRVAALMDRVESLTDAQRAQLHGALRASFRPGEHVRLRPQSRADVMDIALDGRLATVVDVEHFVGGVMHLVVTVDEDPGANRFFFLPTEVERV